MRPILALSVLFLALSLVGCPNRDRRRGDDDDVDIPDIDDDDAQSNDDDAQPDDDDAQPDDDDVQPDDDDADPGPLGFIGGPCEDAGDCDYDDAVCLEDDFPSGMCSQDCELYCPDSASHPTTFCVDSLELPSGADVGDGGCVSRCDFGFFPATGCRPGYGCVVAVRANEPDTLKYVCLPGEDSDLSDCHDDLIDMGLAFEPTVVPVDSPDSHPNLDCIVEDAVYLQSPVLGVDLETSGGSPDADILASCVMARAFAETVVDVVPWDVVTIRHMGTYNCRVIANTDTLSEHSFANAIDLAGFEFSDGELWTLVADWEHDTSSNFDTDAGEWLYESAYRWHDQEIWNIILTPNFNSAHDDHFHVDMTPYSDYIGVFGGRWIGPSPWPGE